MFFCVFQKLQQEGALDKPIPVVVRHNLPGGKDWDQVFTTQNDGRYIEHSPHLNNVFRAITSVWKNRNGNQGNRYSQKAARLSPFPNRTVPNIVQAVNSVEGWNASYKKQ